MTKRLWMNQQGVVACKDHGGYYLNKKLERVKGARVVNTPLDHWLRVPKNAGIRCEECGAFPA